MLLYAFTSICDYLEETKKLKLVYNNKCIYDIVLSCRRDGLEHEQSEAAVHGAAEGSMSGLGEESDGCGHGDQGNSALQQGE